MLTNLFGDMALDSSIKSVLKKLNGFSFSTNSSLRVDCGGTSVAISGTPTVNVTTMTTMTTGNIGIGDWGKPATAMEQSHLAFQSGIRRNFTKA